MTLRQIRESQIFPLKKGGARSTGFEPVTVRLEGGCSIQLSYERRARGFLTGRSGEVKIRVELFFVGK